MRDYGGGENNKRKSDYWEAIYILERDNNLFLVFFSLNGKDCVLKDVLITAAHKFSRKTKKE